MPNIEELSDKISAEITYSNGELWMSKINLDYAYGQAKFSKEASKHCVFSIFGGNFTGNYRFKKNFYGLSNIPTVFQDHIDKVLELKTPVWLDDICVTNCSAEDNERELREVLSKLEQIGEGWIPCKREADRAVEKRADMARLLHESEQGKANKRQN